MTPDPVTRDEAIRLLTEWAADAEAENYHTVCAMLWEIIDMLRPGITERTLILIPLEYSGLEKLLVQP